MSAQTQLLRSTFSTAFLLWWSVAFFPGQSNLLLAQNPVFQASLDVKEVIVGVPFEISFTLIDAEGQRFVPPAFRDFKSTGTVSESRGMTFIKGKTSSKQSWAYTLEATRPGEFVIGSASVVVAGRILNTAPLKIKVLSAAVSPKGAVTIPPGRDDQVFIAGTLSTSKAYPGQQVIWRLMLYTRVAIDGADLISLPNFEGFYSKERRRFDSRTQYQTLRGKKYAVKTLHEESVFPQTSGEMTIGAAQIRVGIEQPGAQGFLYGPKPVVLTTQPVRLTVMPLPEPVPENFTGGVGHYEWEVKADTSVLTTDDALTIIVTLKGNGDSRRFASPKIAVPSTCEIFEPRILEEEEYESEVETVHTKRLEYVVLPKEPGVQEILPVLTYFDIDSNRYCSIRSTPIRFEVNAGKNYRPPNVVDTIPPPIQKDVQIGLLNKAVMLLSSPVLWFSLLAVVVLWGLFLLAKRRKSVTSPLPETDKTLPAYQRFFNVANLLKGVPPETFYNELLKSLQAYIAARLSLSPAQLNQAVLRAKLAERSITPIRAQAFLSILQKCEQAVFSGQTDSSKMESDWEAAKTVVQELEKELK